MPAVITPGPLAQLLGDPREATRVAGAIEAAVLRSFGEDAARDGRAPYVTEFETRRRAQICFRTFRVLRAEAKWSVPRVLDSLAQFLRAELDGTPLDPSSFSALWAVPDSERVMEAERAGRNYAAELDAGSYDDSNGG